jgi:hypothetical protein
MNQNILINGGVTINMVIMNASSVVSSAPQLPTALPSTMRTSKRGKKNRFIGMSLEDVEKERSKYSDAVRILNTKNQGQSLLSLAREMNLDKTTLSKIMTGKMRISDIGRLGRKPILDRAQESSLFEACSRAGELGQFHSFDDFGSHAHAFAVQTGRISADHPPLSQSYPYGAAR